MSEQVDDRIIKRPVQSSDFGFIYDSWPRGVWYGSVHTIGTDQRDWFDAFRLYATNCLLNDKITVACLDSDPDYILGFTIVDETNACLEWIYVKEVFRRQGIGRFLLKDQNIQGVNDMNLTRIGQQLLPKLSTKETAHEEESNLPATQ